MGGGNLTTLAIGGASDKLLVYTDNNGVEKRCIIANIFSYHDASNGGYFIELGIGSVRDRLNFDTQLELNNAIALLDSLF